MAKNTDEKDPDPSALTYDGPDEALLTPIPGEDPSGENLRYDPVYSSIKEARQQDNSALPMGVWETKLKNADWQQVEDVASEALKHQSKDLTLAFWLMEAWTHQEGLNGFRKGLDLFSSLMEEFWPSLHPKIAEDGDLDYRMGPLNLLAKDMPVLLRLLPITHDASNEKTVTLEIWEKLSHQENMALRNEELARRLEEDNPRDKLDLGVDLTPVEWFDDLIALSEACMGELERLDLILEQECPKDAPSFRQIRAVLTELNDRARQWLVRRGGVLPEDREETLDTVDEQEEAIGSDQGEGAMTETKPNDAATGAANPKTASPSSGPITSRAQAYARLAEAADYLSKTEPHSPVPYMVKRAVAWGDLSFGQLLVELMEGGGDHQRVLRLLGLDEMGRE